MLGALIPLQTIFYFGRIFYKPDELVSISFPTLPFPVVLQRLISLQVKEHWTFITFVVPYLFTVRIIRE